MKKIIYILLFITSFLKAQDSINTPSHTINLGQSVTITDIVNTTYSWNTGATTSSITVYPTTTTTYTVTRTTNGNIFTGSVLITVNPPDTSFDISALAFFHRLDSLGTTITNDRKILYNNLIKRLKLEKGIDGITSQWTSLDVLDLFATSTKIAGLQNLIQNKCNPSPTYDYANSFVIDKGFQGKSTSSFCINTNFNPFDGGTYNFKANDNSFGIYLNSNVIEVSVLLSNDINTTSYGYEMYTAINIGKSIRNSSAQLVIGSDIDVTGGLAVKRFPTNRVYYYKNGKHSPATTDSINNVGSLPNQTFELFCRHYGTTFNSFSNNRMAFAWFGNSNVDVQKLERAIIEEYLKPIGAALTKRVVFDGNSFYSTVIMPAKVMSLLWANGIECTSLFQGVWGIPTSLMTINAPVAIDKYRENYFDKECFIAWENTNTLRGVNGFSPQTNLNNWNTYFTARKNAGWKNLIVETCIPYASTQTIGIAPTKRDNPANWNDTTTANGLLRVKWKPTLGIDSISDVAIDTLFRDSHGVAGVGELNTTYYLSDQGHLTNAGWNYVAQNYLYPMAYYYLNGNRGVQIANYQSNSNISIYPNPNDGIFTIESKEKLGQVKVLNMLGQIIYNENLGIKADINLSSQPKGVYIVITDKGVSKIVNK